MSDPEKPTIKPEAIEPVSIETKKKLGETAVEGIEDEKVVAPKNTAELNELIESGNLTYEQLLEVRAWMKKERERLSGKVVEEAKTEVSEEEKEQAEEIKTEAAKTELMEKKRHHKNFRRVMSLFLVGAIIAGGGFIGSKLKNRGKIAPTPTGVSDEAVGGGAKEESEDEETTKVDLDNGGGSEADTNNETSAEDGFEFTKNGVKYKISFYDGSVEKEHRYDFTGDNSEIWNSKDEKATAEMAKDLVRGNPEALAAFFYELDDSVKGDLAGYSRTQLDSMLNGENGADLQQRMLKTVEGFIDGSNVEFTTAKAGQTAHNTYDQFANNPTDSLLATNQITFKGGEKIFKFSDGKSVVILNAECSNILRMTFEDDGSVVITEYTHTKETEDETKKDEDTGKTTEETTEKTTEETTEKTTDENEDGGDEDGGEDGGDEDGGDDGGKDEGLAPKTENTHAGENVTPLPVTPEKPESGATPVEATPENHVDAETNPGAEVKTEDMSDKGKEGIGEAIEKSEEVQNQEIKPVYSPEVQHQEENEVPVVGDGDTRTFEETAPNVNEAAAAENTPGSAENGTRTDEELANRFAQLNGSVTTNNAPESSGTTGAEEDVFGLNGTNYGGNQ